MRTYPGKLFTRPFGRWLYPENTFNGFGKDRSMSHLKALKLASAVPVRSAAEVTCFDEFSQEDELNHMV